MMIGMEGRVVVDDDDEDDDDAPVCSSPANKEDVNAEEDDDEDDEDDDAFPSLSVTPFDFDLDFVSFLINTLAMPMGSFRGGRPNLCLHGLMNTFSWPHSPLKAKV